MYRPYGRRRPSKVLLNFLVTCDRYRWKAKKNKKF